jgi:YegS/Rv2252/BmrU family lipid kinase
VRVLLIANRHSRGAREEILGEAEAILGAHGCEVERRLPDDPAGLAATIEAEGPGATVIAIAGGDGTLNAAAEALLAAGRPLAILPTGTGNDLARTLGLPLDPLQAARLVTQGARRWIDLGRANEKLFFNVASVGLGAELIRHHTRERKRRFWIFAYVLSIRDAWEELHPFTVRLDCDGEERRLRVLQVAVGNGRHYGGGMTVHEDATIDDQQLDVYAIPPMPFWRLLSLVPALRRGRVRKLEEIEVVHCRTVALTTKESRAVNTDGEITTSTPVRFTILPRALEVVVPPT